VKYNFIMITHKVKIQQIGTKLKKQEQLAYRIAEMASEDWDLSDDIIEMVGNS
jgi:2-methylcitrate dehydratase